ncbi:putative transmembrane transcriptional regulator (anti-sigma factor) [Variovorax sp. SRS16]|uniref:anti-sigma factor family protein n=1 Tax=Variovorax sp. SRS16 TaxID=282217 RepID=UPI00131993AC|nr:anti-sigma factor [Variovorax sp. SRS16]VTU15165.1 putative transmembrane transcriptional regulator (anti-sigma factor) [Variovorax sp. SRS16]
MPEEDDPLDALIRQEGLRHAPPAALAGRIQGALRMADAQRSAPGRSSRQTAWPWLRGLALFGAGAATAWGLALSLLVLPAQDVLSDAVTDSHVRSLMGSHLADVASSDRHTVKPWFAGKLDFSPPVVDLADEGLPLTGGRLDYLDGRPVAALVYRAGSHIVNLFVWPAPDGTPTVPVSAARRGYNLVHWTEAGMQFWAASDLNAKELAAFAQRLRERLATADPSP